MKYAQVAAELKAKGELDKVIQMLEQMGQVDYVFYNEGVDEMYDNHDTPDWLLNRDIYFELVEDDHIMRDILKEVHGASTDNPCLFVSNRDSYLAPVGHEFQIDYWEDEEEAGKVVRGKPFAARQVRVNFVTLYSLCPELIDHKPIDAGCARANDDYWMFPVGTSLQYEVGLELLEACRAA